MHSDKKMTVDKCRDSGLALVLLCLLGSLAWGRSILLLLAILFLIVVMTHPPVFRPFARFWFALSEAMGTVVSKIILTVLFYGLVFPVGLARRTMGKDAMQLRRWQEGNTSVLRKREHRFVAEDLKYPY